MTQLCKPRKGARRSCCANLEAVLKPGFFKALCDPSRLAILTRFARDPGPSTVSEVARCCPTDLSVVSRHLGILRDAGILEARKDGRKVFYSVRPSELVSTLRSIADAIEACCPPTPAEEPRS